MTNRAKFFWCAWHHGLGMWFEVSKGWKCTTCEVVQSLHALMSRQESDD